MSGRATVARFPTLRPFKAAAGFTTTELLVTIGIIGVLLAITLPAVQMARESSRMTSCRNNVRQLGLATHALDSSFGRLPRVTFNAAPTSPAYHQDSGWLVEILPSLEPALADKYVTTTTAFANGNFEVYSASPAVLRCPTNERPAQLSPVGSRFGDASISQGFAMTGDYQGNAGFQDKQVPASQRRGAIHVNIPGVITGTGLTSSVTDGLSNTILCWESSGSRAFRRSLNGLERQSWSEVYEEVGDSSAFLPKLDYSTIYIPHGKADAMSYLRAWSGLSNAMLFFYDPAGTSHGSKTDFPHIYYRTLNVNNSLGAPFSFHTTSVNMAMLDGSVRTMDQSVSATVIAAMCSIQGGD